MTHHRRILATVALACLIVAGCGDKKQERNKAAGEVLEGTISDTMIATDAVRSEPPIAPRKVDGSGGKGDKAKTESPSEAEPAESPTPEASPAAEASPAPAAPSSEPAG